MCIIVAKEKGLEMPDREIMRTCFSNNPDGAGIMWAEDNEKVHIRKGFMQWEDFDNFLDNLAKQVDLKSSGVVCHFRIKTHGKLDKSATHPFPISNKARDLKKLSLTTDIGVAHNGIIPIKTISNLSDTQTYILKRLYNIQKTHPRFLESKRLMSKVEKEIASKMAFLSSDGSIHVVGAFIKENGILFSNKSFEERCFYGYDLLRYDGFWYGGSVKNNADEEYVENLKMIANTLGHSSETIEYLLKNGFTLQEIEDYIYEY